MRPEKSKKAGPPSEAGHPVATLEATRAPKEPREPFLSFLDPLGWLKVRVGTFLGDLRLDDRRILGLKHPHVPT